MRKGQASRPLTKLRGQLRLLLNHLEVVDAALAYMEKSATAAALPSSALMKTLQLPRGKKRTLDIPASDAKHVTRHARTRNTELTFHALYPQLAVYLREILGELYTQRPLEVLNKAPGSLRYHEIVELGSYEAICDHMIDAVFRTLEAQRSTRGLLDRILDRTGVSLDSAVEERALMYIDMRHLFVHNGGRMDKAFSAKYGAQLGLPEGSRLHKNVRVARDAINAIADLAEDIDSQLRSKGLLMSVTTPAAV